MILPFDLDVRLIMCMESQGGCDQLIRAWTDVLIDFLIYLMNLIPGHGSAA